MKFQPLWSVARKNLRTFKTFTLTPDAVADIMNGIEYTPEEIMEAMRCTSDEDVLKGEFRELAIPHLWEIVFWKADTMGPDEKRDKITMDDDSRTAYLVGRLDVDPCYRVVAADGKPDPCLYESRSPSQPA